MANRYKLYRLMRRNATGTYSEPVVPSIFSVDADGTAARVLVKANDDTCA